VATALYIPSPPRDLFRTIQRRIRRRPHGLQLDVWHGRRLRLLTNWHREVYEVDLLITREDIERCSTVHCVAGWVTFLTRGGLAFEETIRQMLNTCKGLRRLEGMMPNLEALTTAAADQGAPAVAAHLILTKKWPGLRTDLAFYGNNRERAEAFIADLAQREKLSA
jgi:hypothetical protein